MNFLNAPMTKAVLVSKSDSTDLVDGDGLPMVTRAISVEGAGDIAFLNAEGKQQLATGLAGGVLHPIAAKRILSAGTDATGITAYC